MLFTISDSTYTRKPSAIPIKKAAGQIVEEGRLQASRSALRSWAEGQRVPWRGAMEATLFQCLDLRHAEALHAAAGNGSSSKDEGYHRGQKEVRLDTPTIADLLRCDLLPTCYVLVPEMRDLRRCCAIEIWWYSSLYACRTRWLVC